MEWIRWVLRTTQKLVSYPFSFQKDKDVVTKDGKTVRLSLWDTAGQERMGFLTSSYYRNAQGILIVYDITNPESYKHIPDWLGEIGTLFHYFDILNNF